MQSLCCHEICKYHSQSDFVYVHKDTTEIIIPVTAHSYLLNMMSVLLVPSLAHCDPELDRCTLPSDSSGWSKTQNAVFPRHSLVSLEETGICNR